MTQKDMYQGLQTLNQITRNQDRHTRALKAEGKKVMGYFCCYTPLEILTAADLLPYRILGNINEPTTAADAYMETTFCPFVRSCFDVAMKGAYDFLDGYISPDTCDNIRNLYAIWNHHLKPAYAYYMNVPHKADPASLKFFNEELILFKQSIEAFTGRKITPTQLAASVRLHNENRRLLRKLYDLRRFDPPLVRGSEVVEILTSVMRLPVEEANDFLQSVITEASERNGWDLNKRPRLLVTGGEIDHPALIGLVEACGAEVVADDLCIGSRFFWHDVDPELAGLDGLAIRYLDKIMCPRTYRGKGLGAESRKADLDERFGHLVRFAGDFGVSGAVLYVLKYCDPLQWDVPDLRDYLEESGIPVLHIEHDYTSGSFGPLRTRIQAFLEMID